MLVRLVKALDSFGASNKLGFAWSTAHFDGLFRESAVNTCLPGSYILVREADLKQINKYYNSR